MGERWGKMGKRWVKNEITGLQKTALMHASAHLAAEVVDSEQPNAIGAFVDIPGVGQPLIANPVRFGPGEQTVP